MRAMGYAILAFDGADPSRRGAVRDAHLAVITRWAADGRLALGVPLFDAAWRPVGSLMVLNVPDETHVKEYIAEEPFAREGVWARFDALPFRIAPLPYHALPQPGASASATRTHTISIARDGTDAEAPARRAAAREAHMARVEAAARDGTLALGGMLLDAKGGVAGSIAITRHASDRDAEDWWAEDSYVTGGVWHSVQRWGTRMVGLPYRKLPGAA
jgi:uncharacterized protein YciI